MSKLQGIMLMKSLHAKATTSCGKKKLVLQQKIKYSKVAAEKVITKMSVNFEMVLVEAQVKT